MKNLLIMNLQLFAEGDVIDTTPTEETIPGFDDDGDLGFDDETEGEVEGLGVDPTQEPIPGQEGNEPQTEENIEQKIKIKFNKQDLELPLSEIQTLAQKGMNYDKQLEKLQALESNPGLQYLNQLSEKNGVSVEEMVSFWKQQEEQEQLQQLIQNNIPEEFAKEIIENRKFRDEQIKQQNEQKKAQEEETKRGNEIKEFVDAFGNIPGEEIPQEVWDKVNDGVPLKYAYMEHKMQSIMQENNILKQNKTNKAKAPIKGTAANSSKDYFEKDDFLEGFESYGN